MKETLENAIYKNMAKLLIGDGIARILGFVITPVLTRIYLPAEMGSLAVFTSFVAILIPFSTLRYPLLIPVLKDEKMAFSLSYATFLMLLCSTILLIISLFFFKSDIFSLFSVEELSDFWWLIPISFFSMGLYELFYQWAIRKKEFLLLSKSKILQKSIGSAVQIGLGMARFGSLGLIIGSIFSEAGGLSLFARSFKKDICCNYRFVRWSRMKVILGKFVNYPVYRLPAQFLLSLSGKMPLLYFAWKFGAGMAGQVGLATTMLSIPVTLLGSSVGKAFYAEVSGMGSSKRIEILYLTRKVIQKLFCISLIPTGGLSLFARSFKKDICCNYRFVRWSRMKVILGKFVNYPVYRLPAQFLLSLSGKMPLLYFAWKFGAGMAGQVGLATTMLSIPVTLLGSSVGKAFYAEVSGMGSSKRIEILYLTRKVIQKLFCISLIPTILIVLFAPILFELFFGTDWVQAGVFARILAIYLITQFVYSPISEGLFNILKRQSIVLCLKIIRILIISMAFGACYYWELSPIATLLLYSIGMAANYVVATLVIINAVKYQK